MVKRMFIFLIIVIAYSCESKRDTVLSRITNQQYEELMNMDINPFDQTQEGWRQFNEDPELQILLLSDYIEKNNSTKQSLKWHLGQVHGINNDHENAIKYFAQCFVDLKNNTPARRAWNYYVAGSIAFMENNEALLDTYVDSLQNNDETMNIEVLKRLKKNFGKPYKDAYSQ